MWTVIKEIERANPTKGKKTGAKQWQAKCNECGSLIKIESDDFKKLPEKNCFNCLMEKRATENAEIYSINESFRIYKKSAEKRNYEFTLNKEEFTEIVKSNCAYCGIEPQKESERARKKYKSNILLNGIDRIDNSKGYIIDNVVPCCIDCNRAKSNMSLAKWNAWKIRFVNYNVQRLDSKESYTQVSGNGEHPTGA